MSAPIIDIMTGRRVDERPPGTMRFTLELAGDVCDDFVALARGFIRDHKHMPGMRLARCFCQSIQPFGDDLRLVSVDMPAERYDDFRWHLFHDGFYVDRGADWRPVDL